MSGVNLPIVALAVGDPAGIGPELCLKATKSREIHDICLPVIVGDPAVLEKQARLSGIPWETKIYDKAADVDRSNHLVAIVARDQFSEEPYSIGTINAANGRSALDSASTAISAALAGDVHAVVACPHTQTSIAKAGIKFDGYPSFVAKETGCTPEDVFLMLCVDNVRIAHCTLHVSVRTALDLLTFNRVKSVIKAVHDTLGKTGIAHPKILVAGINPHAGENGLFGSEEIDIIAPAIERSKSEGIDVGGPVSADLMFHKKDVDAFVVMLHDQGHIPAKLLGRHRTAALCIGSPILFSSVAHGSALDIAGKGLADPEAVIEAIKMVTAPLSILST
jgi:4-hydroxythreonine-4-phosphate dehydrogenase